MRQLGRAPRRPVEFCYDTEPGIGLGHLVGARLGGVALVLAGEKSGPLAWASPSGQLPLP